MNYHKITHPDIANGPGCRVTLWVSGCEHQCPGCHNQVTWDCKSGQHFGVADMNALMEYLAPYYISGLTFSGGDPLAPYNYKTVSEIAKEVKLFYPRKTIWLYTGYVWQNIKTLPIMEYLDVVVDGPFIYEQKDITLQFRGSTNQRIISVPDSLKTDSVVLWQDDRLYQKGLVEYDHEQGNE